MTVFEDIGGYTFLYFVSLAIRLSNSRNVPQNNIFVCVNLYIYIQHVSLLIDYVLLISIEQQDTCLC